VTENAIGRLLESDEPAVRVKMRVQVMGQDPYSWETILQQREIAASPRVRLLLSERDETGRIPRHPYSKWLGAHWVLATLADLGYPPGDESLLPLRDQVCEWLFSAEHQCSGQMLDGRMRRCASQEGNALYYMMALGLADDRVEELVERLRRWQWPDGGWNCDRRPEASKSSFHETLLPLRGLVWHNKFTGSAALASARKAAEVFLERRLFRRLSDGTVIDPEFTRLHYPSYWHYDVLSALKVLAEAGFLHDDRCQEGLDLLESKRLADGGFPAEHRFWNAAPSAHTARSLVSWGPVGRKRSNEFVTADALYVLKAAHRLPWPPVVPDGYEG
jgi:hypothetical protein